MRTKHVIRLSFIFLLVTAFCLSSTSVRAQIETGDYKFIDANFAIGDSEGSLAVSLNYDIGVGKRKKIIIGLAGRLTSYFGKNQYYVTAPAELTSGSTGPGVLLKENIEVNMDTFLIKTSQVNCFNLALTLGYNLSERISLRFSIDAIGFSFGKSVDGNYINGPEGLMESASPTTFNLLLISDNDKGSLNSEFFARYLLNDKWAIRGGVQFLFTEFTTDSEVQQFPEPNDRFRNKSLMFGAGVAYKL